MGVSPAWSGDASLLLASHHEDLSLTERPDAGGTDVEALRLAVLQLALRIVQVADATTCAAALARDCTVALEDRAQIVDQRPDLAAYLWAQGLALLPAGTIREILTILAWNPALSGVRRPARGGRRVTRMGRRSAHAYTVANTGSVRSPSNISGH